MQACSGPSSHLADWEVPCADGVAVVLAPHPDDETLGVGGTMSTLLARGWSIRVLAVTDGEMAFGGRLASRRRLAARRIAEQEAAIVALAGTAGERVVMQRLRVADGDVASVIGELADAVQRVVDGASLLLAPYEFDGHPDHEACGRAARFVAEHTRLVRRLEYVVWGWHRPSRPLPWDRSSRVPLDDRALDAKAAALSQFRSQLETPPGRAAILPPEVQWPYAQPYEVLIG